MLDPKKREALTAQFAQQLAAGKDLSSPAKAQQQVAAIVGQRIVPGTALAKQVDEAIEVGVIRAAKQLIDQPPSPLQAYRILEDLYQRQPALTTRSSTSVLMQAYSTPVPIAYLLSTLAGIRPGQTAYEPSAGNGSLLITAQPHQATVNELDPARAATLRRQGFQVTERDAATYVPPSQHDVVIANPPFGATQDAAGQPRKFEIPIGSDRLRTNQIDHAIALNALRALKPGGRAAFIVQSELRGQASRQRHYRTGQTGQFYELLYKYYNVTHHFTLDRHLYRRQGGNCPIDVIAIDGPGPSQRPSPADKLPPVYQSFAQLEPVLEAAVACNAQPEATSEATQPAVAAMAAALAQGNVFATPDRLLTLSAGKEDNTYRLQTPKRTVLGGRYFLDRSLLAATGADFYSVGKTMQCTIPAERLAAVVQLLEQQGRPLCLSPQPQENSRKTTSHHPQVLVEAASRILDQLGQPTADGGRQFKGQTYELTQTPTQLIIRKCQGDQCTPLLSSRNGKIEQSQVTATDYQHFLASLNQLDSPRSQTTLQR